MTYTINSTSQLVYVLENTIYLTYLEFLIHDITSWNMKYYSQVYISKWYNTSYAQFVLILSKISRTPSDLIGYHWIPPSENIPIIWFG